VQGRCEQLFALAGEPSCGLGCGEGLARGPRAVFSSFSAGLCDARASGTARFRATTLDPRHGGRGIEPHTMHLRRGVASMAPLRVAPRRAADFYLDYTISTDAPVGALPLHSSARPMPGRGWRRAKDGQWTRPSHRFSPGRH